MNTKTTRILYSAAFMAAIGFAGLSHADEQPVETVLTHVKLSIDTPKREDQFSLNKYKDAKGNEFSDYVRKAPVYNKGSHFEKGQPTENKNSVDTKLVAQVINSDGSNGLSMTLPWYPTPSSQLSIMKPSEANPTKLYAVYKSGNSSDKPVNLELTLNYVSGCFEFPDNFRSTQQKEQAQGYQSEAEGASVILLKNPEIVTALNPVPNEPAVIGDISDSSDHTECLRIDSDPAKGMTMSHSASTVTINVDIKSVKPVAVPSNS